MLYTRRGITSLNFLSTIWRQLPAVRSRIRTGDFTQKVSLLAGATAGAYAVSLTVAPLLTRIYSTAAFGHLQIYTSLMGFVTVLVALRYELSVVLPDDDDVAANLVAVSLLAILLVTSLLVAASLSSSALSPALAASCGAW